MQMIIFGIQQQANYVISRSPVIKCGFNGMWLKRPLILATVVHAIIEPLRQHKRLGGNGNLSRPKRREYVQLL